LSDGLGRIALDTVALVGGADSVLRCVTSETGLCTYRCAARCVCACRAQTLSRTSTDTSFAGAVACGGSRAGEGCKLLNRLSELIIVSYNNVRLVAGRDLDHNICADRTVVVLSIYHTNTEDGEARVFLLDGGSLD